MENYLKHGNSRGSVSQVVSFPESSNPSTNFATNNHTEGFEIPHFQHTDERILNQNENMMPVFYQNPFDNYTDFIGSHQYNQNPGRIAK